MTKMLASLSLDLENKWTYLKAHGDASWEEFPSYLDVLVPRVLRFLDERNLKITFFVTGQDAALESNHEVLRSIADAHHEIGNHSFQHESRLHRYTREQIREDIDAAEHAIFAATGKVTRGFRAPGFRLSSEVLDELAERNYLYDASTLPTFLGPVATWYSLFTSKLRSRQRANRKQHFGKMREVFRSLKPSLWRNVSPPLLEIPATTMPLLKLPIHVSYLLSLAQFSPALAKGYFWIAMKLCQVLRVEPSLLLHPLDFLGGDEVADLSFLPAKDQTGQRKTQFVGEILDIYTRMFEVVSLRVHAESVLERQAVQLPVESSAYASATSSHSMF